MKMRTRATQKTKGGRRRGQRTAKFELFRMSDESHYHSVTRLANIRKFKLRGDLGEKAKEGAQVSMKTAANSSILLCPELSEKRNMNIVEQVRRHGCASLQRRGLRREMGRGHARGNSLAEAP